MNDSTAVTFEPALVHPPRGDRAASRFATGYDAAMTARGPILLGTVLAVGCGGSATTAPSADSGVGADASSCSSPGSIPDAAIYTCDAGPSGSVGCRSPIVPMGPSVYPEGCMVTLPTPSGFAPCSPLQCTCQRTPGFDDGGLEFICPD
jgi:hypothetical protein